MHTDFNVEVGKRIKKARKLKKISMKKLGELVNLHESTISRYEKGGIMALDIDKLKEFAKVLDVSVSYLMCMDEQPAAQVLDWNKELGEFNFTDSETQEIINFARYIISKRTEQN